MSDVQPWVGMIIYAAGVSMIAWIIRGAWDERRARRRAGVPRNTPRADT